MHHGDSAKIPLCILLEVKIMSTQSKHKDSDIQEIISEAKSIWGQDCKIAPDKTKKGFYRVSVSCLSQCYKNGEIPVNDFIDGRKGRFKGGMVDILLSERNLRQELNRDKSLRERVRKLVEKSRNFGAKNMRMCYVVPNSNDGTVVNSPEIMLKKPGVYYRYKKATGYDVNWQAYERVLETNFGRTGLYAEQALVAVIFGNLFPETKDGQPVRLDQNIRGLLKIFGPAAARLEIDISIGNLLGDDGFKLFVEYDGHQAHRDDHETKVRDRKKEAWARQLGLFIRVPKLKSLNVEMAWNQVIACYEQSHHKKKREFDKLVRKDGNERLFNKIKREFDDLMKDSSLSKTASVKKKSKDLGHRIIGDKTYYMLDDDIQYICGNCDAEVNTQVKNFKYHATRYCAACKGQITIEANKKKRGHYYRAELGSKIVDGLPVGFFEQLVGCSIKAKIACPHCQIPVSLGHSKEDVVDFLKKRQGFSCIHCYNTGKPVTTNANVAGAISQNIPEIQSIVEHYRLWNPSHWTEYFSIKRVSDKNLFYLTLKDAGGTDREMTLSKWKAYLKSGCQPAPDKKEGSNSSLGMDVHADRVRHFHPQAILKGIVKKENVVDHKLPMIFNCGVTSKVGNLEVTHGDFYPTRSQVQANSKKKRYSYCVFCAEEYGLNKPGTDKRIEQLLPLQRYKAALVIEKSGRRHRLSAVKITRQDGSDRGKVLTSDNLLFHCHNPAHAPTISTPNNYFKKNKEGYCRQCLKDVGADSIEAIKNSYHQL
jgi:hypothetical protein